MKSLMKTAALLALAGILSGLATHCLLNAFVAGIAGETLTLTTVGYLVGAEVALAGLWSLCKPLDRMATRYGRWLAERE